MTKNKQSNISFSLIWIIISVILFFAGIVLSASNSLIGGSTLGTYLWVVGLLSSFAFVFYSAFLWFKFKKNAAINNLITAYVILAILFIIGGLVGAFLTYPDGLTLFIVGLGMLGFYFVIKLIVTIFSKEEDFVK